MNIQITISDPKSGMLEFPILERRERRFGDIRIQPFTDETFENKSGESAVDYYGAAFQFGFDSEKIKQRLLEIRQETEELCKADEIDEIYEETYRDIRLLLHIINKTNPYIPMPDIDWAEDGSLNATWIHKKNVITMGVYGNDILHFTYYLEEKRQISSVCELSDKSLLNGVIQIVDNILQE